ncbi:recombinase family protein [Sediminicoccus rosea]|uniref:Recombinase family protein n=1 Tax=Sediminicoccus rosea TaxID=1225128 RepID=A0ABZ0PQJ9_9PROT|nr:recombinase family protein [Sediminicoccus rosea]WPB87657.1 recombinase family protein [Sediminicoccus rosea]
MRPLTSTRPLRVAVYARFSSENQRDASIEDQVRICRARAEREGWVIAETFTDYAVSGSTTLRPGYQALMSAMRSSAVDVVLAESLDRLSRDQEHVAGFHKAAQFAGVRIITLSEGEISELHVGLKGTMGALYLKDLADKTRRGLEGRVREGRSGGGLSYGYRVVRGPLDRRGELERGLREIDPVQAQVVRRVFERFAAGESPIAIAKALNAEGIPGPRGGPWSDGALRGHARVATGILRNPLYAGRLVCNRRRWLKDPTTGGRVARHNDAEAVIEEEVPELRIIPQELWDKVQARLARAARPQGVREGGDGPETLWQHRRAVSLLSGKVVCGVCGGSYATNGKDYMGCKAAERQGTCTNKVRIRRSRVEAEVLEALGTRLMEPDAVATFVAEFTAEWNRLSAESGGQVSLRRRELDQVERQLNGLIDAIADGLRAPGLQDRLDGLGARREALRAELAGLEARQSAPRLHPNLSEVYRARVALLREGIEAQGDREVLEAARALIARVEVHPPAEPGARPRLELLGELSALLVAAGVEAIGGNAKSPPTIAGGLDVFSRSVSVDAGTGFEPVTFRL